MLRIFFSFVPNEVCAFCYGSGVFECTRWHKVNDLSLQMPQNAAAAATTKAVAVEKVVSKQSEKSPHKLRKHHLSPSNVQAQPKP